MYYSVLPILITAQFKLAVRNMVYMLTLVSENSDEVVIHNYCNLKTQIVTIVKEYRYSSHYNLTEKFIKYSITFKT